MLYLQILCKAVPIYTSAPDNGAALVIVFFTSQLALEFMKDRCDITQTASHAFGQFTFTDKCIGSGGECNLLVGVQMTTEDNDQCCRAGAPEHFKHCNWRIG